LQTAEATAPFNSGDRVPECHGVAVWIPSLQLPIVGGVGGSRSTMFLVREYGLRGDAG